MTMTDDQNVVAGTPAPAPKPRKAAAPKAPKPAAPAKPKAPKPRKAAKRKPAKKRAPATGVKAALRALKAKRSEHAKEGARLESAIAKLQKLA